MEVPSVQSMFLILPTPVSQSVESPRIKDDRQSTVSQPHHAHVRSDILPTPLIVLFFGRATQPGQGETRGGHQVEGCYGSQTQQGEGSVTPAPTASHAVHAQLYRHVDEVHLLSLQLHLQGAVQGEGEASLIHINTAIAS